MPDSTTILGIPVDNVTEDDVLEFVRERVDDGKTSQITTVNAEYIVGAWRDPHFRDVIMQSDLRTPDGFGVVLAARRRGLRVGGRVGGSDLIWSISHQAMALGHRIFLLGGRPGVAAATGEVLTRRFHGLKIVGTYAGSPELDTESEQVRLIREARPDILLVAFGAPEQDQWIGAMKELLGVPVALGVGGSFDYVAGVARRAPRWMQNSGLEWLFRLVREPWRYKRMLALPLFVILALPTGD